MIRLLVLSGADVNARDHHGDTPLSASSDAGEATVRTLVEHGADLQASNIDGFTALHTIALAAVQGILPSSLIQLMMDHGADVEALSVQGATPESFARIILNIRVLEGKAEDENFQVVAMLKAEAARRAKCLAFATGQHERLGAGSGVLALEVGVVRMVLEHLEDRALLPQDEEEEGGWETVESWATDEGGGGATRTMSGRKRVSYDS
jgi:hypothetical protein